MNKAIKRISTKTILLFILVSLIGFIQCGNSEQKKQDVQQDKKVKKEKQIDPDVKELKKAKEAKVLARRKYAAFYNPDGSLPSEKTFVEEIFFDKNGYREALFRYKSIGVVDLKYYFEYDSSGNMLSMETLNAFDNILSLRESKYDQNNNEILRSITEARKSGQQKTFMQYNEMNQLVEIRVYDQREKLYSTQTFYYENDLLTSSKTVGADGSIMNEVFYEYDSAGNLIKDEKREQGYSYVTSYKYDQHGNMIELVNPQFKRQYTFDDKDNLIEDKMFLLDGSRQFKVTFTYNEKGLIKEELRYTPDDKKAYVAVYEYEYMK
jgi:hypothetical protein